MISGTGSGCGKTTMTMALLSKLQRAQISVAGFKSGPDYIDPGFHTLALGKPSHNLDPFLMSETGIAQVLQLGMQGAKLGIIEGAMSYYDGIGPDGDCSAHTLAQTTRTPVILIIDASGSASGAAAVALGFQTYKPDNQIVGFLLNGISSRSHFELVQCAIEKRTGLPCIGFMKKDPTISLQSRHLGLVQASELAEFANMLNRAEEALQIDQDRLLEIASNAPQLSANPLVIQEANKGFRMGVAKDAAFSFYYEANLEMLRLMGMELIPFSPISDQQIPSDLDGLYLGGGYPELHLDAIHANQSMLQSIKTALESGLHCYAECGGMMLLTQAINSVPMVGFFPFECNMTNRLQRFGYVNVTDRANGLQFRAHEFHHSLESGDEGIEKAFEIQKASGKEKPWLGGYRKQNTLAAYPHVHFWGNEALVKALWQIP